MKLKIWRDLAILLLISAGIWAVFSWVDCGNNLSGDGPISIDREEEIGDELSEYFQKNDESFKPSNDQDLNRAVQLISQRLISSLDTVKYDYKIHVVENLQINAMAIPGGHIFVFSGLVEFCKSPEELAGVIAHEIGHAQERHVVSRLIRELGITALISMVSGGDPGLIMQATQLLLKSNFSRTQESEADEYACDLMQKAGIDHLYLASFFERLQAENKDYPEEMEMIMTHPHHSDRVKSIRSFPRDPNFQKHPFYGLDWQKVTENKEESIQREAEKNDSLTF